MTDNGDAHRANARHAGDLAERERERGARENAAADLHDAHARSGNETRDEMHRRAAAMHRASKDIHEQAAELQDLHAIHESRLAGRLAGLGLVDPTASRASRDRLADEREILIARRERAADERDRRADERERLADERERLADERERLADERERLADEREARFYAHAGLPPDWLDRRRRGLGRARSAIGRLEAEASRSEEALDRAEARAASEQAAVDREAAISQGEELTGDGSSAD